MARIRTIKPCFFRHEGLYEAEVETGLPLRVGFAGLWTAADREGRFKWLPRQLKLDALPYDEVDFSRVLDALMTRGHIVKYVIDGVVYGCIPSWTSHQIINNRETPSDIPAPTDSSIESTGSTREPRVNDATGARLSNYQGEGKGKERKGSAEPQRDSTPAAPSEPAVISIPLIDKTEFDVTQSMLDEWEKTYPAVIVIQQLREMRQWCTANPANKKTRRGVTAFIVRWLGREQDKAPRVQGGANTAPKTTNIFAGAI